MISSNSNSNHQGKLAKKRFVITGKLSKDRKYFIELIESNGGKVINGVSKNTDFVIMGERPGKRKQNGASEKNTPIISEDEFANMFEIVELLNNKDYLISCTTIRNIILKHMRRNSWVNIEEIQKIIETNYPLSSEDCDIHTETRPTTYPRWKNRLQATLHSMKENETIKHNKDNNQYFLESDT